MHKTVLAVNVLLFSSFVLSLNAIFYAQDPFALKKNKQA